MNCQHDTTGESTRKHSHQKVPLEQKKPPPLRTWTVEFLKAPRNLVEQSPEQTRRIFEDANMLVQFHPQMEDNFKTIPTQKPTKKLLYMIFYYYMYM